jgi:hypothetical protein
MPLRRDTQFHSIALPPAGPAEPPPYHGQGPRDGSLYVPDAEVLARILRRWTATPEDCWFCVWDGYGWESASSLGPAREAPRVQLPHRSYLLYQGTVEAALTLPGLDGTFGQCPNVCEALPAAPDDRVSRVEDWVAAWIDQLLESLLAQGTASLSTPRGSVDARLRRPHGTGHGDLRIEVTRLDGGSGSSWALLDRGEERLPGDVRSYLTSAVLSLTGE